VHIVIGIVIAAGTLFLAYGAITGRVRAQKCCCAADPSRDLRIMNALAEDAANSPT
jgi:hypothetical protein